MLQIGLKLWSINNNYVSEAIRLYEKKDYQYIELYSVPESYTKTASLWKSLKIPFIIHGPHYGAGMNLANRAHLKQNLQLAHEAQKFADALNSDKIIFHSGVEGTIEETIHQLKIINDTRIVIENKPHFSLDNSKICVGSTIEEILEVKEKTGASFCLDFGHAICAANAKNTNPLLFLEQMISILKPAMYHLTDGDYKSVFDRHDRYTKGSFPLKDLIKKIPKNSFITNESTKASQTDLIDFEEDVIILRKLIFN